VLNNLIFRKFGGKYIVGKRFFGIKLLITVCKLIDGA